MADKAHTLTDQKLEEMEKHLSAIYSDAHKDIQEKADRYFAQFEEADKKKRELLKAGKITEGEYAHWRRGKILYGKRFTAMKEEIANELLNVNLTALAYVNGKLPEIYALNYNALERDVQNVGGYTFTLTDADTVKNLAQADKSLLPYKELDPAKDIPWNMKKINSQVLQGVIQGESMRDIAKRIKNVEEMNKVAAIRSARTIVTGAENKGRQDSYQRATDDGIILKKKWIAAIDARTRHWHAELNGTMVDHDKPFENDFGKIMYPGDPTAHPSNVYNCRCTMGAKVLGIKPSPTYYSMSANESDWSKALPTQHSQKEYDEIIKYAEQKDLHIYNIQDFDGDIDVLKEQIDVISELRKEYKLDNRLTILFKNLPNEDFATTNGKNIVFNKKVLRNRKITNGILNADQTLAATDIRGIAAHEVGHLITQKYGEKGIDISLEAYYNVYGNRITIPELLDYLNCNISRYSREIPLDKINKNYKANYYKEIVPEILSKNSTNPDYFTNEFVKLLKEMVK